MKNIIVTLSFVLAASTAMAADAVNEVPTAPAAVETPLFSWTGFNVGIQGGYAWNNQDANISGGFGDISADFDGALAGGFVGYTYQFSNNWVVGVEGDFEANWGDDSHSFLGFTTINYGLDWQGSVRGRVGYAFDRALVYGTAGWAVGRGYAEVVGLPEEKENFNGYTVGVGVDYAFTDMMFGRIEYRYTDFGDKDFNFTGGGTINSDLDQHAIRVGLGVKF
ncbi:outer membrane protein [Agrobacterium rosae]|uniref:outer membrane protein n=1 Tax=Agrobacterium rosae TaxID=1972867 RepID=UPI002A0AF94C|nr:outer membrane protein [Agrobacterium rosae]MDX8315869.1 porin family protein [Agrobacterium rosae]